jgi:hypothetical protein
MRVLFGATLDRNHQDIKNAAPVMSRPGRAPILSQRLRQGGYVDTVWGNRAQAKPGDYLVCYGFMETPTGEVKADINVVDETTFRQTYGPKQGSLSYSQLDWNMPTAPFSAFKTASVHGLHIPLTNQTEITSREGEAKIPDGHVVIVNGEGYPYTNAATRAFKNYRPVNSTDLDRNGQPFSPEQILQSKELHKKLGTLLDTTA